MLSETQRLAAESKVIYWFNFFLQFYGIFVQKLFSFVSRQRMNMNCSRMTGNKIKQYEERQELKDLGLHVVLNKIFFNRSNNTFILVIYPQNYNQTSYFLLLNILSSLELMSQ